jgi:PPOX class F420-dependent enzyme/OxyR family protein
MSVFTPDEIEYLTSHTLARLATVGPDGRPHVIPVTFTFNDEEDAIDVGDIAFAKGKKWRDASQNQKVTLLVDDVIPEPRRARTPARLAEGVERYASARGGWIRPATISSVSSVTTPIA